MSETNVLEFEALQELLLQKKYSEFIQEIDKCNPVDAADLLSQFPEDQVSRVFRLFKKDIAAEVFAELDADLQELIIVHMTDREIGEMLEELYTKFNIDHPKGFRGHSMSVSDIVALKTDGTVSFHYVDRIGFVELQSFMKPENYLKYAEMAMEDDYGMLDGIINNGKAPATEERPSVLGQLKEMSVFDTPHKPSRSHPERDIE